MPTYSVSNVNIGTTANDGSGDPIRTAFLKINQNFTNVYAYANLAYYNGVGGGNGGGNGTTIINNYGGFEGWPNITTTNLAILTTKLATVNPTNLSDLANALSNVQPVNLGLLNNALANVSPVYLGNLQNVLANVVTVNLGNLQNVLATVNVTSLTNFTNVINSITANANAAGRVSLVSNLSANGTANGQSVYNTTNGGLYIWTGNAWVSPGASFTPTATSLASIEIWTTTPKPTANLFEGRTIFNNPDSNLYIYVNSAWTNYNTYIAGSGTPTIAADSIATNMLQANVITATKIATGAIVAGKIAAGAITATEIAAGNITASLLAANAVIAGKIAAGVITAGEIAAGAITATAIAANAITTLKIEAGAITSNLIQANAITSVQIAANSIYANAIQSNSIETRMLRANIITAVEIAANSVYANAIQSNSIETRMLRANIITAVEIAANSVYANAIQSNSIETRMLRANIITAVQIAANSIYAGALMANVITANEIAANAITAVELAANAVYAEAIMANAITANKISANAITAVHVGANVITAGMIDSRGLSIRDNNGNVLFAAGTGLLSGNILVSTAGGTQTLAALTANATPKWLDLKNDAPGFGVANGTWTNQSNIYFTANLNGMTGTPTFTITNGTGTLSTTTLRGSGAALPSNARKLFFEDMTTDSLTIKANFTDSSTVYEDIVSVYKVYNGNTTPLMYLTDENRTLPADNGGTVSSFSGVATEAVVYLGLLNDTNNWAFNSTASGCTITQSGTGNRTITITAMSADTATVTVVGSRSGYSNLTRIYKLSKAKQGAQGTNGTNGTNGTSGTRGSIQTSGVASSWTDAAAYAAIVAKGGVTPIITDQVTLSNGTNFSETKVCSAGGNPGTWTTVVAVFNGSLLVNGTVIADKIATSAITTDKIATDAITTGKIATGAVTADEIAVGALTADKIAASSATLASTGLFGFGTGFNIAGFGAVGGFESISNSHFGVIGASSSTQPGGVFANRNVNGDISTVGMFKFRTSSYLGGSPNMWTYASFCTSSFSYYGVSYYPTTGYAKTNVQLDTASAAGAFSYSPNSATGLPQTSSVQFALSDGTAVRVFTGTIKNAAGAVVAFTGSHDGLVLPTETIELGDILVDVDIIAKRDMSDAISTLTKSTQINQKSVFGVLRQYAQENYIPYCLAEEYQEEVVVQQGEGSTSSSIWKERLNPIHQTVVDNHKFVFTNSIGEGLINVCGENGNIEIGDLISSSSIPGKGMKQDDDIIRSYTVAKARETVTFSSPTEVKQIACTYHCG